MKLSILLPLAALSTAIVIPEQDVMSQIAIEPAKEANSVIEDIESKLPSKDEVFDSLKDSVSTVVDNSRSALDDAISWAEDSFQAATDTLGDEYYDLESWLSESQFDVADDHDRPHPPHGPGHRHPPQAPHNPNKTVYELIAESKYSTKLAELISEDQELVDLLNGTTANFTVFVPIDKAFDKIPEEGKKVLKERAREILSYHISPNFYPAGRILVTRTVPTLLEGKYLSRDPKVTPQRLSTNIGLRGLTVNYYSRVVGANLFGSNGVIHAVNAPLFPPFKATNIISILPAYFSTLELGLIKTGLFPILNDTSNHFGGTLFAPSNSAWEKLGPRINAFLFSEHGEKYLKALLEYHVVANHTLYSDAFYVTTNAEPVEPSNIPKGVFHVDLPTMLSDRSLSIDIARFGRLIDIRINGFQSVRAPDGIAKDGVIHVVGFVIVPPKRLGGGELQAYDGEELTVEDLKERLEPFVEKDKPEGFGFNVDL